MILLFNGKEFCNRVIPQVEAIDIGIHLQLFLYAEESIYDERNRIQNVNYQTSISSNNYNRDDVLFW